MSLVINTNMGSLQAGAALNANSNTLQQAMQRLSTGSKLNSAADNAAGNAISARMTAQLKGFAQATQNTNDAISMVQSAANDLGNIVGYLQRIRELAVQASSGTNTASDRSSLQAEATQMMAEIDRVANSASFNTIKLLNGGEQPDSSTLTSIAVQVGSNASEYDQITIDLTDARTSALGSDTSPTTGMDSTLTVADIDLTAVDTGTWTGLSGGTAGTDNVLDTIDVAIQQVSDAQSNLGAVQNRLSTTVNFLSSNSTNLSAAQSRVADTDYAAETTKLSRSQIIQQAATAMLAQANQQPQAVLALLK
jgi:flagellin